MAINLIFDKDAADKVRAGVEKVYNAVRITLGPKGRNVIIKELRGSAKLTNDGVTIAEQINLSNENEDAGAQIAKQAARTTNNNAGDGTTATIIMLFHLLAKGMERAAEGANVVALQKALGRFADKIKERIYETAVRLSDEELVKVATISANDEEIGRVVAEAVAHAGIDGGVIVEAKQTPGVEWKKQEGVVLPIGLTAGEYFATDPIGRKAIYENVPVVLVDKGITSIRQLMPLVSALKKHVENGMPKPIDQLVVIADEFDPYVLVDLVKNAAEGNIRILPLIAPGDGESRTSYLKDWAAVLGCEVINNHDSLKDLGIRASEDVLTSPFVGWAEKIESRRDATVILGGKGDVEPRIAALKNEIEQTSDEFYKQKIQDRIATLTSRIAIIYVGAPTQIALVEMNYRVEDALNATRGAMEHGVVAGGGVCLRDISKWLAELDSEDLPRDDRNALLILRAALVTPYYQVIENATGQSENVPTWADGHGYDAKGDRDDVDMIAAGIVDPAKVIAEEVVNAANVAGALLTSGVIITQKPRESAEIARLLKAMEAADE